MIAGLMCLLLACASPKALPQCDAFTLPATPPASIVMILASEPVATEKSPQ